MSDLKIFPRICHRLRRQLKKKRIPEMFGAIATSMEASKDYIYPKVTTLKRVKSIYTVNLIFLKLSSIN